MLQNDANKSQLRGAGKAPEQTTLYDQNVGLTDKSHIVSFAGYLMPLWYSSMPSDPPPADYPIPKVPNVVMTPHLGASSK